MLFFYLFSGLFAVLAWVVADGYPPWTTVYQETSMCIAVICLAVGMSKTRLAIPKYFLPFIAVILFPILQYTIAIVHYRQDALISSAYLFLFWLSLILGFNLTQPVSGISVDNRTHNQHKDVVTQGFLIVLMLAAVINAWIAFRQILMLNDGNIWMLDLPNGGRAYGNFGQPNHLATFISMGMIATLIQFETNRLNKYVASLIAIVLIFGSVVTQSRTAWLFAASLPIWWFLKGRNIQLKLSFNYLFGWIAAYFSAVMAMPYLAKLIGLSSFEQYGNRVTAGYERMAMWEQVISSIKYEPFLGYGWGQFRIALMQTVGRFDGATNFESSHNLFLDLIVWNGLPIGLTMGIIIIWLIVKILRIEISKMTFLWLSCAMPIFIHALLEYPLSYAFFLLPFGFTLGLAYGNLNLFKPVIHISQPLKVVALAIMICGLAIFMYEYIRIFQKTQQVRYENAGLTPKIAYVKSHDLNTFTDKLEDYIWFYRLDLNQMLTEQDSKKIEHLYLANPDFPVLAKYIQVQYKVGNIQKAKEAEQLIRVFYPKKFGQSK